MTYSKELAFAKSVAREASKIMLRYFQADDINMEWKGDNTPLTIADTEINNMVIEKVKNSFPGHGVHGEEASFGEGSKWMWVCDPIDGTMPFSHGLPISTFSLALVRNGEPVLGVVYDPFLKREFYAVKGQGAFLNQKRLHVSKNKLEHALIDVEGIPNSTSSVLDIGPEFISRLNEEGANVTTLWSVILPSALVASGDFSATIFNVTKPEDGAAIKVIVEEAGGKVSSLFGTEQRYDQPVNGFLASNGLIHLQLLDLLNHYKQVK